MTNTIIFKWIPNFSALIKKIKASKNQLQIFWMALRIKISKKPRFYPNWKKEFKLLNNKL
jgi:hypothetical protein